MSDRTRRAAGILLITAAALLCAVPFFTAPRPAEDRYRSGDKLQWTIGSIGPQASGNVRVNESEAEELTALTGVGDTYAARIVEERTLNGPFHYPEDLESVRGIGPATVRKFRNQLDMTCDEKE